MTRTAHRERIAEALGQEGAAKVGYPIRIRELEVLRVEGLTPNLLRLTLGGPDTAGFESHVPVEHVRLVLPEPTGELRLPVPDGDMLAWPRPFPPSREYTVRRHDPDALEVDLDVVVHPGGLVSEWATRARPGDRIHLAGPPGGLVVPERYDAYLLAGDLTALPAIARWLERMAPDTTGWAFIEVPGPDDRLALDHPDGVEVRWLHPGGDERTLAEATTAVDPAPSTFVWAAGEAGALAPIRRWVREDLRLAPEHWSITGYWKRGVPGFEHDH